MDNPKISVIVPIYNMEQLMRKCIDSILTQAFTDYECLLIDDGSTDGSSDICDEYAAKDARFKAFHKPNGGLSDARNFGLAHAIGEYTIFFDPDDWVDNECLKEMYAKAVETNADMVMCDIYYNDLYRQNYGKQEPTSLCHEDVLKDLITGKVAGFTVTKLIRRSLYQRYPDDIYGCEDQYTMCALLMNNIQISYLPKAYYHYMHYGNSSQSRRYDEQTYKNDLLVRKMFVDLFKESSFSDLAYQQKTLSLVYRAFFFGRSVFTSKMFKDSFEDYIPIIKKNRGLMKFLLLLSSNGFYHPCRSLFQIGYNVKQFIKKLSFFG